jgi:hypothetical protein
MATFEIPKDNVTCLSFELDERLEIQALSDTLTLDNLKDSWSSEFELEVDLDPVEIVCAVDKGDTSGTELLSLIEEALVRALEIDGERVTALLDRVSGNPCDKCRSLAGTDAGQL